MVSQPREILRSLPGIDFREMDESDSCCGAAGTYGVLHPETAAAIIDRKTGFVRATGASVIATECPACMMQLSYGVRRAGLPVDVVNISQLCDNASAPGSAFAPGSTTVSGLASLPGSTSVPPTAVGEP